MFAKLLIANRGEIACRIIRTARRLGIHTVAVYSKADTAARHVLLADEAVGIGAAAAGESYLRIDKIIAAAKATNAAAIHPGYGFLSENAALAAACEAAGRVFVGPPAAAIVAMGSKSTAKQIMEQAGLPLLPGYHGEEQAAKRLQAESIKIGFPVLIKAAAGGGGKGMRVVNTASEFAEALAAAKREALSAFGDDKVLIEKYLRRPRHIEIQIFADTHGNTVHLYERDCSVQRRYQKILEEAPAPGLTESRRRAMAAAAMTAAKAIAYAGAGTVEFIVDERGAFYFMEMNTRLQVEHPVSEFITGQDLVEWQLRVAAGERLPCTQAALSSKGHALEARIYAEDPQQGFLPATGRLAHLRFPDAGLDLRVETGVQEGDHVSVHYDPMLAKLIVWGRDRPSCLRRMARALAATQVVGVSTNTAFLAAIVAHPAFAAGEVDTGFIERYQADLFINAPRADAVILALAALYVLLKRRKTAQHRAAQSSDPASPWQQTNCWRMNLPGREKIHLNDGAVEHEIAVHHKDDEVILSIGGQSFTASGSLGENGALAAHLNESHRRLRVVQEGEQMTIFHDGNSYQLQLISKVATDLAEEAAAGSLKAPMPGKLIQVLVKANDTVKKGTPLIILEAMKMEHTITAPIDGQVAAIHCAAGDMVEDGAQLLVLEE